MLWEALEPTQNIYKVLKVVKHKLVCVLIGDTRINSTFLGLSPLMCNAIYIRRGPHRISHSIEELPIKLSIEALGNDISNAKSFYV
jgi:hypothetical protein